MVKWSESLTTNQRTRVRFPALPWEFSLRGKIPAVTPPGTTSSSITTHKPSGQRNCASWVSQPQKSVTPLPYPGGRTTKSRKDMWWHWGKKKIFSLLDKKKEYLKEHNGTFSDLFCSEFNNAYIYTLLSFKNTWTWHILKMSVRNSYIVAYILVTGHENIPAHSCALSLMHSVSLTSI